MDSLKLLWDSTVNLHERFYPNRDIPVEARWRVFHEEVGEFLFAASTHGEFAFNDIELAKECADVMVTAMGILMGMGLSFHHLQDAVLSVTEKNDKKSHEAY